jgi:hypothetical protein
MPLDGFEAISINEIDLESLYYLCTRGGFMTNFIAYNFTAILTLLPTANGGEK